MTVDRPRRDWAAVDRNTPRSLFDKWTRRRVEPTAAWINEGRITDGTEALVTDLEVTLQAEWDREQRARETRHLQRGEPGE